MEVRRGLARSPPAADDGGRHGATNGLRVERNTQAISKPFSSRTPRSAIRQPHTAQRHLAAAHARSAIWQPHTTATPLAASGGENAAARWCPRRWARQRAARPAKRRALDATPAGGGDGGGDRPVAVRVDGGNAGGGDSYAAPSSANRAEAACEPMPAIVASAHRCPQCSRRARVQLHACHPSVTRDHDLRARRSARDESSRRQGKLHATILTSKSGSPRRC